MNCFDRAPYRDGWAELNAKLGLGADVLDAESTALDINLFAGAGGLAIGLRMAGFSPCEFYEIDRHSCDTLRYNTESSSPTLEGHAFQGDLKSVDWYPLDRKVRLLAAGVPCQPFSLGGKHQADRDGRNLFPDTVKAIRQLRPSVILLENVRGLVRDAFRPYFEYVLRQLECPSLEPKQDELWQEHSARIARNQLEQGYKPEYRVKWSLLDAADFGVPQNRQRVLIVGTRSDLPQYEFPVPTHSKAALVRSQCRGEYWERHGIPKPDVVPGNGTLLPIENDRLPWVTVRDALKELPEAAPNESEARMNHWTIPGAKAYAGHKGSLLDWPSKTIKAGVHGVPGGENTLISDEGCVRYYTLREAAKIQAFPDTHFFAGARLHITRQIGNAVPCLLAAAVARPLYELVGMSQVTLASGGEGE